MLSNSPRVTQQGLKLERVDSVSGTLFTFSLLLPGLGFLKDGDFDWSSVTGRQGKESIIGRMDWQG